MRGPAARLRGAGGGGGGRAHEFKRKRANTALATLCCEKLHCPLSDYLRSRGRNSGKADNGTPGTD